MSVIFADNFDAMSVGTSPPTGFGTWLGSGAAVIQAFAATTYGHSVQVNSNIGGFSLGPSQGFGGQNSGTIYSLNYTVPNTGFSQALITLWNQSLSDPTDNVGIAYLKYESDGSLSVYDGQNVLVANTWTTPSIKTGEWWHIRWDIKVDQQIFDLVFYVLLDGINVYINDQMIISGASRLTGIPVLSLPSMISNWNYMSFLAPNNLGYVDNLSLVSYGDPDPFLAVPKGRESQMVLEFSLGDDGNQKARLSQAVIERGELPPRKGRLSQYVIELPARPGSIPTGGTQVYEA